MIKLQKEMEALIIEYTLRYLKHPTLYEILLWILISYLVKGMLQEPPVYAESVIDFLPGNDPNSPYDPFDYPVTINGGGIPHTWDKNLPDNVLEEQPNGNTTCEDAAYNERNPLSEDPELDALFSEELTNKRFLFIDTMLEHIDKILHYKYPNGIDIPEDSIKNTTYIVLQKYGDLSDWMANTEVEIKDPYHEINLRIHVIQQLIENEAVPVTTKHALTHMATCLQMINSAHVLDIPTDKIESDLLKPECYDELYKRYKK
jgi:hypothetical protein